MAKKSTSQNADKNNGKPAATLPGEILFSDIISDENRLMEGDHVAQLIANIEAVGLINPITLSRDPESYPPVYSVVAGRSRYRALFILRTHEGKLLPGEYNIVEKSNAEKISFSENFLRRNLTMKEEIDQLEQLHDIEKLSVADIMTLLGRSKTWVKSRLNLKNLIPAAREKIGDPDSGISTIRQWEEIAKFPQEAQEEMLECFGGAEMKSDEDFKENIRDEFTETLDGKYFALDDVFETLPTCAECQLRTGADVDLFGELSGDTAESCLQAECYKKKKKIVRQKRLEEANAAGMIIYGGWEVCEGARSIAYVGHDDIDPEGVPNCYVHSEYEPHAGKRICLNTEALKRVSEPKPAKEKFVPQTAEEKAAETAKKKEAEICKKISEQLSEIIRQRIEEERYFNWDERALVMIIRSLNLHRTVYHSDNTQYGINDIPQDIRHYVPTAKDLRAIERSVLQTLSNILIHYNHSPEHTRILAKLLEENYDQLREQGGKNEK